MQGSAKRSRHIMDKQLVSFGNFLFSRYDVQVFSTDGKNKPLYKREVTRSDISNWKEENPELNQALLPSAHQIEDYVDLCLMQNGERIQKIRCEVLSVHFYAGKVKYDLEIILDDKENLATRVYNVDSAFVSTVEDGPKKAPEREDGDFPRRYRLDLMTPAERTIFDAIQQIELLGADVKLTNAQVLLTDAKNLVSDYIDQNAVPSPNN